MVELEEISPPRKGREFCDVNATRMQKGKNHILTKKSQKRKRQLRKRVLVAAVDRRRMEQLLP